MRSLSRSSKFYLLTLLTLVFAASTAQAGTITEVFFDDFDGNKSTASGVTGTWGSLTAGNGQSGGAMVSVENFSGYGVAGNKFSGKFFQNWSGIFGNTPILASTLVLQGLPDHTHIDIDFLLAIIDSWDGSTSPPSSQVDAPDYFNVSIDGVEIFKETFDTHRDGTYNPSYTPPAGGLLVDRKYLGFSGNSNIDFWYDSGFDMGIDPAFGWIAHTSSTLTIKWYASGVGYLGGAPASADESWAIENVRVRVMNLSAVPEPSSIAMVGLGMALSGMLVVRRRSGV